MCRGTHPYRNMCPSLLSCSLLKHLRNTKLLQKHTKRNRTQILKPGNKAVHTERRMGEYRSTGTRQYRRNSAALRTATTNRRKKNRKQANSRKVFLSLPALCFPAVSPSPCFHPNAHTPDINTQELDSPAASREILLAV